MRPLSLELRGFASFRDPTVIDLGGVDLFALTGPTGAGKSSVLDAIVFALYGCIPRYDDRRAVAPVITQGSNEAKVALDFTVGPDAFKAIRIVRRTAGGGATTKEARLFQGDRQIAANADELTEQVEKLLGLNFDQFTKCVLLPQGDFARFLHDKGADRNELLRKLLGVGLYRQLFELAGRRAAELGNEVGVLNGKIETYADATAERLQALLTRAANLKSVQAKIDEIWPKRDRLQTEANAQRDIAQEARASASRLREIQVPEGVQELAANLASRQTDAKAAARYVNQANQGVQAARLECAKMPAEAVLVQSRSLRQQYLSVLQELKDAKAKIAQTAAAQELAQTAHDTAEAALAHTDAELTALHRANAAHLIAAGLKPGESCPVCGSTFQKPPTASPAQFESAEAKKRDADRKLKICRTALQEAVSERQAFQKQLAEIEKRRAELEPELQNVAALEDLDKLLETVRAADARQNLAQDELTKALESQAQANEALQAAESKESSARSDLSKTTNSLAVLQPPFIEDQDIASAWADLAAWAKQRAEQLAADALAAETKAAEFDLQLKTVDQHLAAIAEENNLDTRVSVRDACIAAISQAEQEADRCEKRIAEAADLHRQAAELEKSAAVYRALKSYLQTNAFEAWVLNRSFTLLCETASQKLRELSRGQYSIAVRDKNDFEIVDHFNADERRSVKTLSGGETFLASLALALSLAEQVAAGAARLESLFLDEGFGALDPETLDVVASAVEELGASGRMIGVVTHVRDFADRLPVRFDVRKDNTGSRVEKVLA